jgi:hypothetical protein
MPDGSLTYAPNCTVTAPLNPRSEFPAGFQVMFGEQNNPQWKVDRDQQLVVADYAWEIGKIGSDACTADGQSGWIAFSDAAQGYGFAERFRIFPQAQYPDGGSTVECWTVGKGKVSNLDYESSGIYLMETEVLSPFYTFQPGERHSFQIEWGACRTAGRVLDVQPGGCASQKLLAKPEQPRSGRLHFTGIFGAFDSGQLMLTWSDGSGEGIGSTMLKDVNPDRLVVIDEVIKPADQAVGAVLSVVAKADGARRDLGKCNLF